MGKNPLEQENANREAAVFQQSCACCMATMPMAAQTWFALWV
jgi:hypothetical protein